MREWIRARARPDSCAPLPLLMLLVGGLPMRALVEIQIEAGDPTSDPVQIEAGDPTSDPVQIEAGDPTSPATQARAAEITHRVMGATWTYAPC